jgi:hypothetical protein
MQVVVPASVQIPAAIPPGARLQAPPASVVAPSTVPSQSLSSPSQISTPPFVTVHGYSQPSS